MQTSKQAVIVALAVTTLLIVILVGGGLATLIKKRIFQEYDNELPDPFDEVDRNMAIQQLTEFRGRILEIESLSRKGISQDTLWDELEGIISPQRFTNQYLKDFTFVIPNTSDIGELCGELISQINDQIQNIEYGEKGE